MIGYDEGEDRLLQFEGSGSYYIKFKKKICLFYGNLFTGKKILNKKSGMHLNTN